MILKRRKEVDVVQMSEGWKEHDTKKEREKGEIRSDTNLQDTYLIGRKRKR